MSIRDADGVVDSVVFEWIRTHLVSAVGELEPSDTCVRISARIVGDDEMDVVSPLQRRAGATDVLTFVESSEIGLEVDLPVCREVARRASELGHDVRRELLCVLHGVPHAVGFDDHAPEDHARMHAEEDRILERIGVGRTFDRGGDA